MNSLRVLILNYYFLVHFSSSLTVHNRTIEIQCDEEMKTCDCPSTRPIRMKSKRIIGGERVIDEKTWPWMVSLRLGGHHICGGAIISTQFMITAAHCITNGTLTVAFGLIQQSNLTRNDSRIVSINRIYLHPAWNSHTMKNDLALIRFEHRLETSVIKCLCLPSDFEVVQLESEVMVIGFGRDKPSRIRSSNYLHQIQLRILPSTSVSCQNEITDNKTQICAGLEIPDKDTCQGDSGGPLMFYSQETKRFHLIGIVSHGTDCGLANHSGVYTRVSAYVDWIRSILNSNR